MPPKVIISNNNVVATKNFLNIPKNDDREYLIDGNRMRQVEAIVYVREDEPPTSIRIEFPEDALLELRKMITDSGGPVEAIVQEFVHRRPVLDHIKAHGYDLAQVAIALVALFKGP